MKMLDNTAMISGFSVPMNPPTFDQQPALRDKRRTILIFTGINLVNKCQ